MIYYKNSYKSRNYHHVYYRKSPNIESIYRRLRDIQIALMTAPQLKQC